MSSPAPSSASPARIPEAMASATRRSTGSGRRTAVSGRQGWARSRTSGPPRSSGRRQRRSRRRGSSPPLLLHDGDRRRDRRRDGGGGGHAEEKLKAELIVGRGRSDRWMCQVVESNKGGKKCSSLHVLKIILTNFLLTKIFNWKL